MLLRVFVEPSVESMLFDDELFEGDAEDLGDGRGTEDGERAIEEALVVGDVEADVEPRDGEPLLAALHHRPRHVQVLLRLVDL